MTTVHIDLEDILRALRKLLECLVDNGEDPGSDTPGTDGPGTQPANGDAGGDEPEPDDPSDDATDWEDFKDELDYWLELAKKLKELWPDGGGEGDDPVDELIQQVILELLRGWLGGGGDGGDDPGDTSVGGGDGPSETPRHCGPQEVTVETWGPWTEASWPLATRAAMERLQRIAEGICQTGDCDEGTCAPTAGGVVTVLGTEESEGPGTDVTHRVRVKLKWVGRCSCQE